MDKKPGEIRNIQHSSNVVRHEGFINRTQREQKNNHRAACYWFTGLSGSGKSTLARNLEAELFKMGRQVFVLDGDNVRYGLCGDLGFSITDRQENIRRVAHVAHLMYEAGFIVLCCFISPERQLREYARALFKPESFIEVYVKCPVSECIKRDPKGLYKKALTGEIPDFTGISAPYEDPGEAEIVIDTLHRSVSDCVRILLDSFE